MKIIKRNNNKAYTIMEVLAVIILIGIILIITFPLITNAIIKSKYRYYESQENTLLLAGRDYFTADRTRLPKAEEEEKTISLRTLVNEGYTKPILDTSKDGCNQDETTITVKRLGKGEYRYYVRLKCNDYDTDDTWEWSDWSFNEPGFDTEYEVATVYNYQTPTIVKGEWGPWEYITAYQDNNIIPISKEGKVEQLEPEVEYQTVYQYRDQFWKWYQGGTETSACSSSTPGTGWIKSTACEWNWSHTVCATSKDGYTKGTECRWNWSHTSGCQASTPGTGYSKISECYWTYTRPECYSSCSWISTYVKNNTAVPGGYTSCTSRGIYRRVCHCVEGLWYPDTVNGWYTYKKACTAAWLSNPPGGTCTCPTSACCTLCGPLCSGYGMIICGHDTAYQYQCKAPLYSTCAASTPSGINWSKGSACRWTWKRTVCQASTPGTSYTKGTACYWNFTKTVCAASTPGTGYVKGTDCSWIWKKDTVVYADGYHATAPTGYPNKDSDKYIYTDWSEPSTTPPPTQANRIIEPREQKRLRTVTATWQGNRLTQYMKYDDINNYFQEQYGKTFEEINTDPLFYLVSATMYRYKVKVY